MSVNKVRNLEYMSQPVLTEGLVFGRCGCTDIDLSLDWQGKTFVFVELKYGMAPLPLGQKLHLQALVDGLRASGKTAYAILAYHGDDNGPIMAKDSMPHRIYSGKSWEITKEKTLHLQLEALYSSHLLENPKRENLR